MFRLPRSVVPGVPATTVVPVAATQLPLTTLSWGNPVEGASWPDGCAASSATRVSICPRDPRPRTAPVMSAVVLIVTLPAARIASTAPLTDPRTIMVVPEKTEPLMPMPWSEATLPPGATVIVVAAFEVPPFALMPSLPGPWASTEPATVIVLPPPVKMPCELVSPLVSTRPVAPMLIVAVEKTGTLNPPMEAVSIPGTCCPTVRTVPFTCTTLLPTAMMPALTKSWLPDVSEPRFSINPPWLSVSVEPPDAEAVVLRFPLVRSVPDSDAVAPATLTAPPNCSSDCTRLPASVVTLPPGEMRITAPCVLLSSTMLPFSTWTCPPLTGPWLGLGGVASQTVVVPVVHLAKAGLAVRDAAPASSDVERRRTIRLDIETPSLFYRGAAYIGRCGPVSTIM